MWTHVSLNVDIVWEDVLWRAIALWEDEDSHEPVALERSGRVPLPADGGPSEALSAAAGALRIAVERGRPWMPRD